MMHSRHLSGHHLGILKCVKHPSIFRATPEQRDLLDRASSLLEQNESDFILEAACERARLVDLDQVELFSVSADKFQQFAAVLDAAAAPNAGLERLMAVRAPWDTDEPKGPGPAPRS